MEVTFFRHGIAVDRADPLAPIDFERPLTLDGKNKTESAARGLRALDVRPALVLSSPYKRCVQTARLLAQALGVPKKSVREIDALDPHSDPHSLWPELALIERESILCVGHGGAIEPTVGLALGLLAAHPEALAALDALDDNDDRDDHDDRAEGTPTSTLPFASASLDPMLDAAFRTLHLKKAGALQLDVRFDPVLSARLSWLVTPRILRQLGRT